MRKQLKYLVLLLFCLFSFLACKTEEVSIKNKFTQKYTDFYDQKDNAFILIAFEEKEFLDEEIWNNVTLIDPQKTSDKDLGKIDGYYWIIACDDIDISLGNHYKEEKGEYVYTELQKLSLKKGESFIKVQYDDPYDPMVNLYAKSKNLVNKNLEIELSNFYPSDNHGIHSWADTTDEEKENSAFIALEKEEKSLPNDEFKEFEITEKFISATGKVDLDENGNDDTISFLGDSSFGWLQEITTVDVLKQSGSLKINDEVFSLDSLAPYDATIDRPYRILDIYVIDIDPKDKYKEILLQLEDSIPSYYRYLVFHYKDDELHQIGEIDLTSPSDLKYKINQKNASFDTKCLSTIGNMEYNKAVSYKLNDSVLVMKELAESEFKITTVATKPVNIYKEPDSDEILFVAQEGQHFIFLKTDNHSWVEVKEFENGQKGYLRFTENDSNFSFYQQEEIGESFEDVFDHVPIPVPKY